MMQRRQFLRNSLLLGAAGTVPGATLAESPLSAASPLLADADLYDLLDYAITQGKVNVFNFFASLGFNVNTKDKYGSESLLCSAASWGRLDIIQCLVSHGADVNPKPPGVMTPLHAAACNADLEVIQYLVSQGADVHAKNHKGETALDYAVLREAMSVEIAKKVKDSERYQRCIEERREVIAWLRRAMG